MLCLILSQYGFLYFALHLQPFEFMTHYFRYLYYTIGVE